MEKNELNKKYFTPERKVKIMFENGLVRAHSHNFIEIVYFDKGNGKHILNGEEFTVQSGDLFVINRDVTHYYSSSDENSFKSGLIVYNCIFDVSFFEDFNYESDFFELFSKHYLGENFCKNIKYIHAQNDYKNTIKSLIVKMFEEYNNQNLGYLQLLKANVIELLIKIMRQNFQKNIYENYSLGHMEIIEAIIKYIQENFNNCTIQDITLFSNYSASHLNKIFKAYSGITVYQYIQQYRMRVAASYLKSTNFNIDRIMEEIGCNDKKRFYSAFKKENGCTPGLLRKSFESKKIED